MANSADPEQWASSDEANWSRSTLFAKVEYIWVQKTSVKSCFVIFSVTDSGYIAAQLLFYG